MATGYGLIPIRKINGGQFFARPYVVAAANGTNMCVGDVVELDPTGDIDVATQLPLIVPGAASRTLLGVIVGFLPDPTQPYNGHYRAASTRRVVLVCDDPDVIYSIQEDAVGGVVSAANIGQMYNALVIIGTPSIVTGLSTTMLDSSTVTVSAAALKIVGVVREPGNVAAQTGGAKLEVMLLVNAIRANDSVT